MMNPDDSEIRYRYPQGRILVFARAPHPGQVKSRLIPKYGKRGTAQLYRLMLRDVLRTMKGLAPMQLWCSPNASHAYLRDSAREANASVHVQKGADLGQRMFSALESTLNEAPWAIVVGSDCVSLSPSDMDVACASLQHGKSAVLGPALDGGYVLFGLRRLEKGLFQPMPWGTDRVLAKTRQRLLRFDYDWAELPVRWDADLPREVRRWQVIRGNSRWSNDKL